ncbi:hypothetical protein HMPREF9442_03199 [Paraprevotella xylaniphila YIT 11841]|uniref:Uncharacterized protein n=1 Tax=Paraprevotella xylaniphila YIT 11841 TaxID=762982 RepID=F3QYA6_9BACT|nr:hypothetical protein HMPREF9442_03199 [Paraprevotella xylaniphila YIT 11841]
MSCGHVPFFHAAMMGFGDYGGMLRSGCLHRFVRISCYSYVYL